MEIMAVEVIAVIKLVVIFGVVITDHTFFMWQKRDAFIRIPLLIRFDC